MNAVKKYGIACKNVALTTKGKVATGSLLLAANSPVFAQETESAVAAAINAAKASGMGNVTLAVVAIVGIAALVMGITVVLRLINR